MYGMDIGYLYREDVNECMHHLELQHYEDLDTYIYRFRVCICSFFAIPLWVQVGEWVQKA